MRALAQYARALIPKAGRWLGSLQCTTLCLGWLALLVFWGTLYQARVGLYAAELRFFDAWVLWAGRWLPLPATRSVLLLLSVNLVLSMVVRIPRRRGALGLWLIHGGFVLLLAGGLWSSLARQEGRLWLTPGLVVGHALRGDGSVWNLPMSLSLLAADEVRYPGTDRVKSYTTRVLLNDQGQKREAAIALNKPLRAGNWAFYQVSFMRDGRGIPWIGLLVCRNPARWLPYAFSLLTGLGLLLHFGLMYSRWVRRSGRDVA